MALIDRRNRGLTYRLPASVPRSAPPRPAPTMARAPEGSSEYAQMAARMQNAKALKEQEPEDDGGGRGIGWVLGKALKPLEVLDYPRRAVTLGMEQTALALPDWAEALTAVPTMGLGALTLAVDEDKVREDERSNWEKLGDPTYGFGQITGDMDNRWADRIVGLAGDLALDPLTYATFGAGSLAKKGLATTGRAARLQRVSDAAQELNRAGRLDDETIKVLRQVAEQGYSPATGRVREALDLGKPGLRFQLPFTNKTTGVVPGTQKIANAVNAPIEGVRGAVNRSRPGQRLADLRTPKDLEKVYPILAGGKGSTDDFIASLDVFAHDQARRQGAGRFRAIAAQELKQRSEAIKNEVDNQFGGNLNEYLRATEVGDVETELNRLSKRMVEIADSLGVELPEIEGIGYLPHMLSPEFRNILERGDPFAEAFKEAAGVRTVDTLRDSGFLSARAFRPDPQGVKQPLRIGDRQLKIDEGSIAEINEKVAELFPGLKTSALETDPMTLFEKYIEGVANDVGIRYADRQVAQGGLGKMREIDNIAGREAIVPHGTDPMADNEFFKSVLDEDKTQAANERIATSAEETVERNLGSVAYPELGGADVIRQQVAEGASDLRRELVGELRERRNAISAQLRGAQDRMSAISQNVKGARAQQVAVVAEADKEARRLRAQAGALTRRLKAIPKQVRTNAAEAQRQVVRELNTQLNDLRRQGEELNQLVDEYLQKRGAWQAGQEELDSALRAAEDAYAAAVRRVGGDLPPARSADEAVERVALAESQRAEQAAAGIDRPYGPLAPDAQQRVLDSFTVNEGAGSELAPEVAAIRAADKELQQLVSQRNELSTVTRRIETIEQAMARRKEAIATYDERVQAALKTQLRGKAYRDRIGPAPSELRAANSRAQKNLTKLRKERRRLSRRAVYRDIDDKIAAKRAEIEELRSRLPERGAATNPYEQVDRARRQRLIQEGQSESRRIPLDEGVGPRAGTARLGRRVEQMNAAIPRAESRLMNEVAQAPGSRTRAIGEGIEDEIRYRSALPQLKRSQKLSQADEAQAQAARRVQQIDEEVAGSYEEYRALMNEDQALRQERHEVRKAIEAAPHNRDALTRLSRSAKGSDEFPDEVFGLRPDRGKAAKALRDAQPTDAGLHRVQPLNSSLDDIEELIRLNPNMDDEDLRRAEVLLHQWRTQLDNASTLDMKANQAQAIINKARNGQIVDVVTAQIDQAKWKLMPEGDIVMAQEMARLMQNVAMTRNEPKLLGQTLTAFTNFFKTYATLSPGFHVRNAISATFMNSADGVPMSRTLQGVNKWKEFLKADDPLAYFDNLDDDWKKAFDAVFGSGTGGRFLEEGFAEATMIGRTRIKEGIYRNRATVWSQKAGQRVEGSIRLGMAYDTIKRGGTVDDALNRVTRIHFDYSQVSKFDESAKRLIPFWTFMSRNLPMQITQMWMKPRRYNQYQSFVRNFAVNPDEFTPEYILTTGGFDTGERTPDLPGMAPGMPIFLQPDLAHVRVDEDIERLLNVRENPGGILSDFNPYFTAPIEYATGRDLFTGRVYQEDDYKPAEGIVTKALIPLLWALGQTKQGTDGQTYIQERGIDALRALAPPLDRVSRLAPGQTTGDNDRAAESYLRFLGVPVRTVSDEQRRNEQRSRYYDRLDERDLQRVLAGG